MVEQKRFKNLFLIFHEDISEGKGNSDSHSIKTEFYKEISLSGIEDEEELTPSSRMNMRKKVQKWLGKIEVGKYYRVLSKEDPNFKNS
jgi:hypothetical protein